MSYVNDTQLNYFAQQFWTKCKGAFDGKGSAAQALVDAKAYADGLNTAMDTRMQTVEGDVAVLKGDVNTQGSVAYQIAQVVAGADASYDTLKEIADWIMNDTTGATKMANDIATLKDSVYGTDETDGLVDVVAANKEAIANLEAFVGELPEDATATTVLEFVQEYVEAQLEASDLSQYAKAEDLEALEAVVGTATVDNGDGTSTPATGMIADIEAVQAKAQANEDAITVLNGDETVEGSVAKAVADAKAEVDADVEALDGRISANETAIGVETDTVNGVVATGIYARLEALEVPITNGDIDNIINGLV